MSSSESITQIHGPHQSRSGFLWTISDYWVMTKRSVMHIIRSLDQVASLILFPIMFMLLNRYVLGGSINTGIDYVDYLSAGILVQTLAFGANYTTINLAVDLKEGIVDRFKTLPMASSALLVGHIISDMLRNIISGLVIVGIGYLVGFRPNATAQEWLIVFGLAMLFTLAISWLSAILGLLVKSLEAAQWIGFVIIFPLTFISSAFVRPETLSGPLEWFAMNQPLSQVINAMRALLVGTPMNNALTLSIVWCVGIIAIAAPTAVWMFKKRNR